VESKLLSAVTGIEISEEELNRIGERVYNLERAIMVREGRTRREDTLHESYFRKTEGSPGGNEESRSLTNLSSDRTTPVPRQRFEEAKEEYYRIRGWDEKTGYPTQAKLTDLGLEDIAEKLHS